MKMKLSETTTLSETQAGLILKIQTYGNVYAN